MAFGSPSNGPGCWLERGWRRWSPERSSEAARGKEIAGVCHIGGPGVSLTRFWVRSDQHRTRDPPGSRSGHGGTRSCARDGRGDSGRWGSPAWDVRAAPVQEKGCKKDSWSKREVRATGTRGCAGLSGTAGCSPWRGMAARTPGTGVLASRARHSLCYLAQKDGEVALMLTKGLGEEGRSARRLATRSGGGPWRSARRG